VVTVSEKIAVRVSEPLVPVTVTVEVPVGVVARVAMVSVVEQEGEQLGGEKDGVAPAGRPEAENETDAAVPERSVVFTALITDEPWTTERSPPVEIE
jgi:hypothetical protein